MNNSQEKKSTLQKRFGKKALSAEASKQTFGGIEGKVYEIDGELYFGYESCHEIAMETGASGRCIEHE